jgi:hypothetical protein
MAKATGIQFTVQGPRGWSRSPYGSFAGKAVFSPPASNVVACIIANTVHEMIVTNAVKQMISVNAVHNPIQAVRCGNI